MDKRAPQRGDENHGATREAQPASVGELRRIIETRLPRIRIEDLLVEVDSWCGFTREFTHLGGSHPRVDNLYLGVNVLASTRPLDATTAQAFFESFYEELLPHRAARGIAIADAIRRAVARCETRFRAVPYAWQADLDSFIFYGDPTAAFHLR